jgi:hypothetical protein
MRNAVMLATAPASSPSDPVAATPPSGSTRLGSATQLASLTSAPPSRLDGAALSRRLAELAGDEREVQVAFLLHLGEFDRRRAWAEQGYGSLWDWCLRVLHLREGAAGRRIAAMRVLRRFPRLAAHLRDGGLCLSTAALLGPVLTEENVDHVLERAAFMTRAEVDRLVASLSPRAAPRDGLRKAPAAPAIPPTAPALGSGGGTRSADPAAQPGLLAAGVESLQAAPRSSAAPHTGCGEGGGVASTADGASGAEARVADPSSDARLAAASAPAPSRPSIDPVDGGTYSLRVTVDVAFKADLDLLRDLLGHKAPSGDLTAVLREAVQCAVRHHAKRRGLLPPAPAGRMPAASSSACMPEATSRSGEAATRPTEPVLQDAAARDAARPISRRPHIPAAVRRQVWARDGGRCTWRTPDGHCCGSTWQLELDHLVPVALGGASSLDNLRLTCRSHNQAAAEQVFGREFMERLRVAPPRAGELAISSGSGR